jgi:hypothetical protein
MSIPSKEQLFGLNAEVLKGWLRRMDALAQLIATSMGPNELCFHADKTGSWCRAKTSTRSAGR